MKYIILVLGLAAICSGSSISGRIQGGLPSANDDKFAVTVYSVVESASPFPDQSRLSTGVAISQNIIVVVAQAIYRFNSWRVGVNSNVVAQQTITDVESAKIHEKFNPETLEFNVGVLKVLSGLNVYITLASQFPTFPILFGIGFGYIDNDGSLPSMSQQTALHIIDFVECRQQYNQRVVRPTNFCVDAVSRLAPGDQGAPLVDFSRQQLVGSVSFWNDESTLRNPVVVTNLVDPLIREFLLENL